MQAREAAGTLEEVGAFSDAVRRRAGVTLVFLQTLPTLAIAALVPVLPDLFKIVADVPHSDLLVPMVLDLAPSACEALVNRTAELERFGFELESFGGASIKVTAVPALLKIEDCSKALLALAEDLEGLDRGAQVQDALQRIAATTACHAAVKANYPLTYEKMMHILEELRATAYSTICPHGRPVMLRLTRREIEKNFERI